MIGRIHVELGLRITHNPLPITIFFDGQDDLEDGVAGNALEGDHAVVLVDEILREGEAQAAAAGAAGDQRVKDASLQLGRDAGTVVADYDLYSVAKIFGDRSESRRVAPTGLAGRAVAR